LEIAFLLASTPLLAAKNMDDELKVIRLATATIISNQPRVCIDLRIRGYTAGSLRQAELFIRKNGRVLPGFSPALAAIKAGHKDTPVDDHVIAAELLVEPPMRAVHDSQGLCAREEQYSFAKTVVKSGNAFIAIDVSNVCSNRIIIASFRKMSSVWKITGWDSPTYYVAGPPGCAENSTDVRSFNHHLSIVEASR
jgi:hypothetical protein